MRAPPASDRPWWQRLDRWKTSITAAEVIALASLFTAYGLPIVLVLAVMTTADFARHSVTVIRRDYGGGKR